MKLDHKLLVRYFLIWLYILAIFDVEAATSKQCKPTTIYADFPKNCPIIAPGHYLGAEELSIVIKALTIQKSEAELNQDKVVETAKETNDTYLIWFTGILALVTGLLWWETFKIRQLSVKQAKDTQKSLELISESNDISVKEKLPIFIIENIYFSSTTVNFCADNTVDITLGNHGQTSAIIVENCLNVVWDDSLSQSPSYPQSSVQKVPTSRVVDKSNEYKITRNVLIPLNNWDDIYKGKRTLWVNGYIDYIDFLRRAHRMGFSIKFVPPANNSVLSHLPVFADWEEDYLSSYHYDEIKDHKLD
jgi:hypothetical protein